jgi:LysR family transcriptional regulator for metE and metH
MGSINTRGIGSRAPMHLAVRDLRLIVTIAQMGGVSRAADALHLTQSTLSHHLADLETRVGAPLFHRSGRNLVLTPLGEAFKEGAGPLLDEIASLERDLRRGGSDQLVGSVHYATECYTTYAWLARVTRKFQVKCPNVELRLITEATPHPMPALETGTLDLAITMGRPAGRKFHALPLFEDELVALVAPDHAWAAGRSVSVEAFRDAHLLIYHSDPMDSSFIRNVLLPAGVFPRRVSGIQVTEGLLEFAKAGLGVSVLARWVAAEPIKKKALVPLRIGRTGVHRTWHAVWLRTSTKHEWLESFAGLLQAHALR